MASILVHMAAVQRLASDGHKLPPDIARALSEDIEYARFGVALPTLPKFGGIHGTTSIFFEARSTPHYYRLFHGRAQVAMGLKMAELVANGALVGTEPGLAFVSGYFTHLCIDRVLTPHIDALVPVYQRQGERPEAARSRIELAQAVLFCRELYGRDLIGTPAVRGLMQIVKRRGPPTRGVGRGLYELLRLSSQEAHGAAPTKADVDAWVRGLYVYALLLSSPIGKWRVLSNDLAQAQRAMYRNSGFDFRAEVEKGLALAQEVLERLAHLIRRGRFTPRVAARFLESFPESSAA